MVLLSSRYAKNYIENIDFDLFLCQEHKSTLIFGEKNRSI